ncbi:MAG: class I SAM-dependent methyltransferase [Streptosporangiaceae bacterium]
MRNGAPDSHAAGGVTNPVAPGTAGHLGWRDDNLAREWADGDRLGPLLALPRRITGAVLAAADPPVRVVLDVGSGPGAFLAAVLDSCPDATGIWTDVSAAMQDLAQERLAPLSSRIEFRLADATDLAAAAAGRPADAVLTSRFSHHLDPAGLRTFYADAAELVGPGGWIANLDHISLSEPWAARLARVRAEMVPPNPSAHRHDRPLCALRDHLGALSATGWNEVTVAWQAFATVLILGRRTS